MTRTDSAGTSTVVRPKPTVDRGAVRLLVALIRAYQAMIRPWLIGSCKFCPTCSEYAVEAMHRHGLRRGAWLATRRVLRCHPFGPGGIDPVPVQAAETSAASE